MARVKTTTRLVNPKASGPIGARAATAASKAKTQALDRLRGDLRTQMNWMLGNLSSAGLIDLTFQNVVETQRALKLSDAQTRAVLAPYRLEAAFAQWTAKGGKASEHDVTRWSDHARKNQSTSTSLFSRYSFEELRAAMKVVGD